MKQFLSNIWFLLKRTYQFDRRMPALIVLEVLVALGLSFFSLYLTQEVINLIVTKVALRELIIQTSQLIGLYALLDLAAPWVSSLTQKKRQMFRIKELSNVSSMILRADYQLLQTQDFEEAQMQAVRTVNSDDSLIQVFPENLKRLLEQLAKLILFGSFLSLLDRRFLGFIGLLLVVVISYRSFQHRFINNTRKERALYNNQYRYIDRVTSNFALAKDVRLFRAKPWFEKIFHQVLRNLRRLTKKRAGVVLAGQILSASLILGITIYGYSELIQQLLAGQINLGQLTFYIGALSFIAAGSTELVNALFDLFDNSADAVGFRKFVTYPNLFNHEPKQALPTAIDSIEFRDVSFTYPKTNEPVFSQFNLTLHANEKLALVGLNGAGKTTLVKLLCNLYQPDSGQILINGLDNQLFDVTAYYDLFSVVFQDHFMLPITIKQMILQSEPFDEARYERVLQLAGLKDMIEALPLKDETPLVKEIDPQGVTLSGGQQQKLKLAQALYKDGQILILDEPTSALDPLAESEVYRQYHDVSRDKLSIFVTHRLATTQFCDRILFLADGRVIEDGTHHELMNQAGRYKEMFDMQAYYYQTGVEL